MPTIFAHHGIGFTIPDSSESAQPHSLQLSYPSGQKAQERVEAHLRLVVLLPDVVLHLQLPVLDHQIHDL